jgi:predicted MFS family arabinose efflux permease
MEAVRGPAGPAPYHRAVVVAPLLDVAAVRRRYLVLIGLRWFGTGLLIPIFTLLMVTRGLTLPEIGLVAATQGLTILLLELPTGGLSDALGRRPVLLLSSVFAIAALGALYLAESAAGFMLAAFLLGIFRSLDSGPLEAWFVDSTHAADATVPIESGLAAGSAVLSVAIGVAALLSGGLIALDPFDTIETFALPVLLALVLAVANLVAIALLLAEARPSRGLAAVTASVRAVPGVVRDGFGLVGRSRILAALIAVELSWGFAIVAFESLFPLRLAEVVGGTEQAGALMGPAASAAWFASAGGAAFVVLVSRRIGVATTAVGLRLVQGLTILGIGLLTGPIGVIGAYLACYLAHGASNPMHMTLLHREVDAGHRTTVISLNSMVFHPAAAVGALVLTSIAAASSLTTAMVVAALVCAAAASLYLPARRAERARAAAGEPVGNVAAPEVPETQP